MKKFLNTLALSLCLLFGSTWLFATDYPGGGGAGVDHPTQTNTWTADQTFNDSVNITMGTGGDVDIAFVTPNLVIDSQVVGTGHVIIQEATVDSNLSRNTGILNLNTTSVGNSGPGIVMQHDSATPADNDDIGGIHFTADDSGGTSRRVGTIRMRFTDVTSTEMDSTMRFQVMQI